MNLRQFCRIYNKKYIEDYGPTVGPEFLHFARDFKDMMTDFCLANDCKLACFKDGYYEVSGSIEHEGGYIYFSYNVPRCNYPIDFSKDDKTFGLMYRTQDSLEDVTGGPKHFTSIKELEDNLGDFIEQQKVLAISDLNDQNEAKELEEELDI